MRIQPNIFVVSLFVLLFSACSPEYVKLNNRGYEKTKVGDYVGALEDFNLAIMSNDKYWLAYANRASSYAKEGFYEKAIMDYTKSISLHKRNPLAYSGRGNCYAAVADTSKAITDYKEAILYEYNNYIVYAYLGRLLAKINQCDEANYYLNTAIKKRVANDCISQKELIELRESCE